MNTPPRQGIASRLPIFDGLIDRILDMNVFQRCQWLTLLMLVQNLQYDLWALWATNHQQARQFLHIEVIQSTVWYGAAFLLVIAIFHLIARSLAAGTNESLRFWLPVAIACFYSLNMSFFGYLIGTMSLASGIVMVGAPIFGFLLLEKRVVYCGTAVASVLVVCLTAAALNGTIPYAPLLQHDHLVTGPGSLFWVYSLIFFILPYVMVLVGMSELLINKVLERESEVRYLSERDPLTGLLNRRSINHRIEHFHGDEKSRHSAIAILLIDLDHFKQINDNHGHPTGDRVLELTAQVLRDSVRQQDMVGRFGGEEFIIVLLGARVTQCQEVADRIRLSLKSLRPLNEQGIPVDVAGSIGIAWSPEMVRHSFGEMVQTADAALYRSKTEGRNRVTTTVLE